MVEYIRQVVTEVFEIKVNTSLFNADIQNNYDEAYSLARSTTYWIYDLESNMFGPSKFLGFKEMTFERYLQSKQDELEGDRFSGGVTRRAIIKVLENEYEQNSNLSDAFRIILLPKEWSIKLMMNFQN